MEAVHTPVLLDEVLELLAPNPDGGFLVDGTMGEGGHSIAMLSRYPRLRVLGIDADGAIQALARERLREFGERVSFFRGWAQDFFESPDLERPDRILLDLGISSFHYERSGRGFSFRKDEPLDMRLDPAFGPSAAVLLVRLSEGELADVLYQYGEERYSRRIARAIKESRRRDWSSGALAEIVEGAVPASYRRGPLHPATRTFLALRSLVNGELSRLPRLLEAALGALKPGGRMGVISFHSLEDRLTKNFFREKSKPFSHSPGEPIARRGGDPVVVLLTKKGICPGEQEVSRNPPSRSARLRGVEKIKDEGTK